MLQMNWDFSGQDSLKIISWFKSIISTKRVAGGESSVTDAVDPTVEPKPSVRDAFLWSHCAIGLTKFVAG